MTTWGDLPLAPRHVEQLKQSAISAEVAGERGYETVTTIRSVKRLGFAASQCLMPGLLIPIHGIGGELESYQYRPDQPRSKDGRINKYEQPAKSESLLDVPKRARAGVMSKDQPLIVTEGTKKADAGATRELAIISIAGVWNWRASPVIAAFDQIPLKERTIYLGFDSDWRRKRSVRTALDRLAAVFRSRGAIVYGLCLPEPVPGQKAGLDDYFVAGNSVIDLFHLELVELVATGGASPNGHHGPNSEASGASVGTDAPRLVLDDFLAYLPVSKFIYAPTGDLWDPKGVDQAVDATPVGTTDTGNALLIPATAWLTTNRPVHRMTWVPGEASVVEDRFLDEGGWIEKAGVRTYNHYRPPRVRDGDAGQAEPWVALVERVYPLDAGHLIDWLAHRVQRPGEKVNHAIVLGGAPGIGKDTILEPVVQAVGPWNVGDVSPPQFVGRFNAFLRKVILRISELRDLGDVNRYGFYEATKTVIAAPPDALLIDEKNVRAYHVPNLVGVVFTSNHRTDGLYLPADDRRHYVTWSELTQDDFPAGYWDELYSWFEHGGVGHVAAYLRARDLSNFDPKAAPPKTRAFWDVVDAGRAPEDADMADALDYLGAKDSDGQVVWRKAVTVAEIITAVNRGEAYGNSDFAAWLKDRKNSRQIPHRFDAVGYVKVGNPGAADGLWKIDGRRMAVYAMKALSDRDRIAAAMVVQQRYGGATGSTAGQ